VSSGGEGRGEEGRRGEGIKGKNDLTHPLSHIPGYATVVDNSNFQRFRWPFFGKVGDKASVIIQRYAIHRQLFSDPKMHHYE